MRGGKRNGAGRKKGSKTQKTTKAALKAVSKGITPVEVMLNTMRELYRDGKKTEASAIAKDVAPYTHSRMPVALIPSKPADESKNISEDDEQILDLYMSGIHEDSKQR